MIIPTLKKEKLLWQQGYTLVAGVDEAGRGPWAGPVTAGAVCITTPKQIVKTVRDSKLMSSLQREKAYEEICQKSQGFGIGIVASHIIDIIGITEAVKQAMLQALQNLQGPCDIHRKTFHPVSLYFSEER